MIILNPTISLDFKNSDGVAPHDIDFESVAAHEIGHILGFHTAVDDVDTRLRDGPKRDRNRVVQPTPLDLFRFDARDKPGLAWSADDFRTGTRWLAPGGNPYSVFGPQESVAMSSGIRNGDGQQAAHWRIAANPSERIGMMSPTLPVGFRTSVMESDKLALDLLGWDIKPPPPTYEAGDADLDLDFDQTDLIQILRAKKYLTGLPATWGEGDWNVSPDGPPLVGDGIFDQEDLVAALMTNNYLMGSYAAKRFDGDRLVKGEMRPTGQSAWRTDSNWNVDEQGWETLTVRTQLVPAPSTGTMISLAWGILAAFTRKIIPVCRERIPEKSDGTQIFLSVRYCGGCIYLQR